MNSHLNKKSVDNFNMKKNYYLSCRIFGFFLVICLFASQVFAQTVYKEKTIASFYGADFNGKMTSNGETFNMNDFTCANKFLPFDTLLKVTNLANNLSVVVRVNDRGPFVEDREVDLSKAAAQKLDMIKSGTAQVKIEIIKLGPNTKLSTETAQKACEIMERKTGKKYTIPFFTDKNEKNTSQKEYPKGTYWDICIASFSDKNNATSFAQKLHNDGFKNIVFQKANGITRVVLKKIPANQVKTIESELKKKGYTDYLIKKRKK